MSENTLLLQASSTGDIIPDLHYTCHGCRYQNDPDRHEFLHDSPWDWLPEDEKKINPAFRHYIAGGGTLFVSGCSAAKRQDASHMGNSICIGLWGCIYWEDINASERQLALF